MILLLQCKTLPPYGKEGEEGSILPHAAFDDAYEDVEDFDGLG